MTAHIGDEIPGMLRGEARRQVALTTTAHLRVCSDCRDELITALAAHVALTSAARLLHEIKSDDHLASAANGEFADFRVRPPIQGSHIPALAAGEESDKPQATPEVTTVLAWHRRRGSRGLLAAAVVIVVAGVVAAATVSHGPPSRSVSLSAYGVGTSNASATFVGSDALELRANLPALESGSYYEVWLTDGARTVMTPVGDLSTSGTTGLSLSSDVVSHYADIEVSVQSAANGTGYSGISVLRGQYKRA